MANKKLYHFLSSAARPQYAEDIIRALALPKGSLLQFRYKKNIVDQGVHKDISAGKLIGQPCLISFLHSHEKGVPTKIIPCRYGTIVRAEAFGPFVVVEYSVTDFANCASAEEFTNELREFSKGNLPEWKPEKGDLKLFGLWAFSTLVDDLKITRKYNFTTFANTVEQLSNFSPFSEESDGSLNPFFHISILKYSECKNHSNEDAIQSAAFNGENCPLEPSTGYRLRIHHYFPNTENYNKELFKYLVINFDSLAPQADDTVRIPITSGYDVKDINFRTLSSPYSQQRRLTIKLENRKSNSEADHFSEIIIPVTTKPAIVRGFLNVVAIGSGVAVPAIIGASFRPEFGILPLLGMIGFGFLAGLAAVYGLKRGV